MKFEVDCYSGRRNPVYSLREEEIMWINEHLKGNTIPSTDRPQHLGYRCMILHTNNGEIFVRPDSILEDYLQKIDDTTRK